MRAREPRATIDQILQDVVAARDPAARVRESLFLENDVLRVPAIDLEIELTGKLVVLGIGKASPAMVAGAVEALGDRIDQAVAVTKAGLGGRVHVSDGVEVIEASHPVPDEASLAAGQRLLQIASELDTCDVVLMLISGGGSALVESLADGITLADLQAATDSFLRRGATINQLNAMRSVLSRIKAGGLARAIAPARIVNLIVSDVLGNPLPVIASGPTVDVDSDRRAEGSLYIAPDLIADLPASLRTRLEERPDATPTPITNIVGTVIIDDAQQAALDAIESARRRGYRVQSLGFDFQGEAREFGRFWGSIARHAAYEFKSQSVPVAYIGAGELTVTVRGSGIGGRNTEMALAAAIEIAGLNDVCVASFATDGDDGDSRTSGGVVDGDTLSSAEELGLSGSDSLRNNDSASLIIETGSAIDVGPTGTNVNDVYIILVGSPESER